MNPRKGNEASKMISREKSQVLSLCILNDDQHCDSTTITISIISTLDYFQFFGEHIRENWN